MGRPDYIFGQFRETARCHDAQHGGGVCCALAPQLADLLLDSSVRPLKSNKITDKTLLNERSTL